MLHRFTYLPVRGRLEPSYLYLSHLGLKWETETVAWKEFRVDKRKQRWAFAGQLPEGNLVDPATNSVIKTTQSGNILKCLADFHQPAKSVADRVKRDEFIDASLDLGYCTRLANFPSTLGKAEDVKEFTKKAKFYFKYLDSAVLGGGSPYLLESDVTAADFAWCKL